MSITESIFTAAELAALTDDQRTALAAGELEFDLERPELGALEWTGARWRYCASGGWVDAGPDRVQAEAAAERYAADCDRPCFVGLAPVRVSDAWVVRGLRARGVEPADGDAPWHPDYARGRYQCLLEAGSAAPALHYIDTHEVRPYHRPDLGDEQAAVSASVDGHLEIDVGPSRRRIAGAALPPQHAADLAGMLMMRVGEAERQSALAYLAAQAARLASRDEAQAPAGAPVVTVTATERHLPHPDRPETVVVDVTIVVGGRAMVARVTIYPGQEPTWSRLACCVDSVEIGAWARLLHAQSADAVAGAIIAAAREVGATRAVAVRYRVCRAKIHLSDQIHRRSDLVAALQAALSDYGSVCPAMGHLMIEWCAGRGASDEEYRGPLGDPHDRGVALELLGATQGALDRGCDSVCDLTLGSFRSALRTPSSGTVIDLHRYSGGWAITVDFGPGGSEHRGERLIAAPQWRGATVERCLTHRRCTYPAERTAPGRR